MLCLYQMCQAYCFTRTRARTEKVDICLDHEFFALSGIAGSNTEASIIYIREPVLIGNILLSLAHATGAKPAKRFGGDLSNPDQDRSVRIARTARRRLHCEVLLGSWCSGAGGRKEDELSTDQGALLSYHIPKYEHPTTLRHSNHHQRTHHSPQPTPQTQHCHGCCE